MISTACGALVLATLIAPGVRADAASDVNTMGGTALRGFDPVVYFAQNKAVLGSPHFTAMYRGVTYEFAAKEDQAAFQANPEKYVPQYGGFCAFATSRGVKDDATRTNSRSATASSTSTTASRRGNSFGKTSRAISRRPITIGPTSPSSRCVSRSSGSAGVSPGISLGEAPYASGAVG